MFSSSKFSLACRHARTGHTNYLRQRFCTIVHDGLVDARMKIHGFGIQIWGLEIWLSIRAWCEGFLLVIMLLYVSCGAYKRTFACIIVTKRAYDTLPPGESLPPYNPNVLLGMVTIGKLVVTTVISCASDKKEIVVPGPADSDSVTDVGSVSHATILEKNPLIYYALPSVLYNITDLVMFITIGTISPGNHTCYCSATRQKLIWHISTHKKNDNSINNNNSALVHRVIWLKNGHAYTITTSPYFFLFTGEIMLLWNLKIVSTVRASAWKHQFNCHAHTAWSCIPQPHPTFMRPMHMFSFSNASH